jgi:methyl-accepting chemotaxis protein
MKHGKTKADASVTYAAQAGDSLQSINDSVATINNMNIEIASASEQQSVAAEEITKNVTAIQNTAAQSALGAEKTASASNELLNLASRMQALVGQFRA